GSMLDHKKIIDSMLQKEEAMLLEKEERFRHLPKGYLVQQDSKEGARLYWAEPVQVNGTIKDCYHR
ncbi:MAG: hypothetical protein IKK22_03525, partial [Firmicutes bacterium]|nr:hypothetical protein [Bacillota bacterium]